MQLSRLPRLATHWHMESRYLLFVKEFINWLRSGRSQFSEPSVNWGNSR